MIKGVIRKFTIIIGQMNPFKLILCQTKLFKGKLVGLSFAQTVGTKLIKAWLFGQFLLLLSSVINSIIGIDILHFDSDSEEAESKKPSSEDKGKQVVYREITQANATYEDIAKNAPKVEVASTAAYNARAQAMMSNYINININNIRAEMIRLGLDSREAETQEEMELKERYAREVKALAEVDRAGFLSLIQAEKDKLLLGKLSEVSTGVKRDLTEGKESASKKVNIDTPKDSK